MMGHVIGKGRQNLNTIETKTEVTLKVCDGKLYIKAESEKSEKLAVREIRALGVSILGLKWYCDENHIFPIEPILKLKQVACMTRKMLFTIFKYLFLFQRYLSF